MILNIGNGAKTGTKIVVCYVWVLNTELLTFEERDRIVEE